jgi:hypothetical protein
LHQFPAEFVAKSGTRLRANHELQAIPILDEPQSDLSAMWHGRDHCIEQNKRSAPEGWFITLDHSDRRINVDRYSVLLRHRGHLVRTSAQYCIAIARLQRWCILNTGNLSHDRHLIRQLIK